MSTNAISRERYSNTAVILHWLIALLVIGQLAGGYVMANLMGAGTARFTIYQVHKTLGLLILGLSLGRILWRVFMRPPPLGHMAAWEKGLAHLTHFGFYFLLLAIPLSGWVMVSASETGVPTYLFLQEALPFYHLPVQGLRGAAEEAHELLSWGAFILLGLHVAGALKHQFIDRQPSLSRMAVHRPLPQERGHNLARLAVFAVIVLFPVLGVWFGTLQQAGMAKAAPEAASSETTDETGGEWLINYEESELTLEFIFGGSPVNGSFGSWQASVSFAPDRPEEGSIEVVIDTATASFSDTTLNSQAAGADGFDPAQFPEARFVSSSISQTGQGEYLAEGTLTIRGVERPLSLPFSFTETDGAAVARGEAVVNRLDYGIGASGAPSEEWLSHQVQVNFTISAERD